EHGISLQILSAAGMHVEKLRPLEEHQDPPDCEGIVDGVWTGIEVTELVDEKTLAQSIKAIKQREAGKEPDRPAVYLVWSRENLLKALQERLDDKDRPKLKGDPYDRYIVVIHTDEDFLSQDSVGRFLDGATFHTGFIDAAFLGLSYHPAGGGNGSYPVFRLPIIKDR